MSFSIAQKLLADLKDAIEEVNEEHEKITKSAMAIANGLRGGFEKTAMRAMVAKFDTTFLEEKLEDLSDTISDVKSEYNL